MDKYRILRGILLKMLLPYLLCIAIGGIIGWTYPYAKGHSLGKIRQTQYGQTLNVKSIRARKYDICKGAVIGGVAGLGMLALTFRRTIASIAEDAREK